TYGKNMSIKDCVMNNYCIAIGFLKVDLSAYLTIDKIEDVIEEKKETSAGQKALKQFFSMKEGVLVALKSTFTRKIDGKTKSILRISAVGKITSDDVDVYHFSEHYGHLLQV